MLPQVLFWLGLVSVPFAWLVWYFGPQMEMVRPVLASISDPALRAALQEAHAERLGIWVAIWPVSLLVLSQILEKKMQWIRKLLHYRWQIRFSIESLNGPYENKTEALECPLCPRKQTLLRAIGRNVLILTGVIKRRQYWLDLLTLGRIWVHAVQIIHQGEIFGPQFFLEFGNLLG